MLGLGIMEALVLLLLALFLIGVPMMILALVIYITTRQRRSSSHPLSQLKQESRQPIEEKERSGLNA